MKTTFIIFLSFWISFSALAQGPGNRMNIEERYRSQKIAFITDKLQLTSKEARDFWPIYNQFEADKDALTKEMHAFKDALPQDDNEISEEQAEEFLVFFNKHNAAMYKLNQENQKKILKVISTKKLVLLTIAENEFRRHLLQEFRGRNARNRPN